MKRSFIALAAPASFAIAMAGVSPIAVLAQSPGGVLTDDTGPAAPVVERGTAITRIEVVGNIRVEEATVRQYLPFTEGEAYTEAKGDRALKELTNTGLFSEVSVDRFGSVIRVTLSENPVVNIVAYEGNSRLSDEDLSKESGLAPRQILTRARIQSDVNRIQELYRRAGRFSASIEPQLIDLGQNRVNVVFAIDEGPETGIKSISFLNNNVYSDSSLRQEIVTTESKWWNFFTSQDNYDPDRITFDREQLRRFYLRNGYADFRVDSAVAELARDRSGFYVTFTLSEGERYDFGNVEVTSNVAELSPEEMLDLVKFSTGDTYNAELVEKTVEALTFYAGSRGYAFAEIKPRIRRDAQNKVINIVFNVEQGPRVYIERINIVGNTQTLDKVIRREIRLSEGDAFNKVLIERSKTRIKSLGFFKEVEIEEEPGSSPDKTVLNVKVEETTTGELQFGLGYSAEEGLVGDLSVTQRNLLGRGQFLRLRISLSDRRRQFDFRFTEPYFLDRNLAFGVDAYDITSEYTESSYEARTLGGGLRLGFPLSEFSQLSLRYSLRQDEILPFADASPVILGLAGTFTTSVLGYTYFFDNRDDPVRPTSGFTIRFDGDYAGLGGDVEYYRHELDIAWYRRLWSDDFIFSASLNAGYIDSFNNEGVRLNDRFFKGGTSFRGFEIAGIGPRDVESFQQDAVGAQLYAIGTLELTFPNYLPKDLGIDTNLFVDVGTVGLVRNKGDCVAGVSCIRDDLSLRASAGVSVFWDSPFGRVRLDFSKVFLKEDYDKPESFRFSAGTQF